ncbi:MAG: chemotaxis-specific protein-glutamate methyltransferase CheB [Gemmatimonadota bacterium]|nr:chemotaxis-specific protein-glutamate methyltransferase CheB [Gemmatimonadota bacterium]
MIRVLVAEDSRTVQELLVAILESDPAIRVVGCARTGAEAVELAGTLRPDLITMDIHMPGMDGVEATKEIMARWPTPIVIVASSRSQADTDRSFHAMRAGALMLVSKPDNPAAEGFNGRRERLLAMVKAMAEVKVVRRWDTRTRTPSLRPEAPSPDAAPSDAPPPAERGGFRVVAIGASTGGPAALQRILEDLPRDIPVPLLVVQHIAEGFVAGFADWLAASCNQRVTVAVDGEALAARTVYIAPEGAHLGVTDRHCIELARTPPIEGLRPSATHLFRSVARVYGARTLAVILTGMGRDGVGGLRDVRAGGGYVIAQDEATSVVHGMPGEAVGAGLASVVLPIQLIGPAITQMVESLDANENPRR